MAGDEFESILAWRPALAEIEAAVIGELVGEVAELTDFATEHQHGVPMSAEHLDALDDGVTGAYERYGALGLQVAMVRCCIAMVRHWTRHAILAGGVEAYLDADPDLEEGARRALALHFTGAIVLVANGLSDDLAECYDAMVVAVPNRGVRLRLFMSIWLAFVAYGSDVGVGVRWCERVNGRQDVHGFTALRDRSLDHPGAIST